MAEREGRSAGREIALDDELAGGGTAGWQELELDSSAVPAHSVRPSDPSGAGRIIGDPFDELGLPEPDPPEAPRSGTPSPAPPSPLPRSAGGGDVLPIAEIEAIADYGPPPSGLIGSIPYAILVFNRRLALRRALSEVKLLRSTAQRDADNAMIELGRALHAKRDAEALRALGADLALAEDTGRAAGQRSEEWARAREATEAQRESIRGKLAEAEKAAAPYRDRETKLAAQMNVRETDLKRANAKLSRIEIEQRNAKTDPARAEALAAEHTARKLDAETAKGHVDALTPELTAARRELATMLAAINDLTAQLRALDAVEKRSESLHLTTAGDAERSYHDAVKTLATNALARGVAEAVAESEAKLARRHQAALSTRDREVRLHEAALKAYDAKSFHRGAAIIGGAAFLILLTLLFVILR